MAYYNPIVRTFCRIRAALVEAGVDRHLVRPAADLAALLPSDGHVAFRAALVKNGGATAAASRMISPTTSEAAVGCAVLTMIPVGVLAAVVATFGVGTIPFWIAAAVAVITIVAHCSSMSSGTPVASAGTESDPVRPFYAQGSVGELTLRLTKFRAHKSSGYRFTRNEIAFKVKRIVSEQLGIPLEEVTEGLVFADFD